MIDRGTIAAQIFAALSEPATVDDGGGPVDLDHGAIIQRNVDVFDGAAVAQEDRISLMQSDMAVASFQRGQTITDNDGIAWKLQHRLDDDGVIVKFRAEKQ